MTDAPALSTFGLSFLPPDPFLPQLQERFSQIAFVTPETADKRDWIAGVEGLFAWSLSTDDVDAAPALRWVQWVGAGVETAPLQRLAERGILLTNNRGVHAPNIAEHLMSMMLAFTRQLPVLLDAQARHVWSDNRDWGGIGELQDSRLLILGAGQIGRSLATRAEAFGMQVTLVGRESRESPVRVFSIDRIDDLLPLADHVAICMPLTHQTRNFFDAERIARLKAGAFLYNIGRGPIVDTNALVTALRSGRIGGAGLDVIDPEPLPPDHPLWDVPNVIITAHTAGITPNYWQRAFAILADNIDRFNNGTPLRNLVSYDLGY